MCVVVDPRHGESRDPGSKYRVSLEFDLSQHDNINN